MLPARHSAHIIERIPLHLYLENASSAAHDDENWNFEIEREESFVTIQRSHSPRRHLVSESLGVCETSDAVIGSELPSPDVGTIL